jgi:hypothetical protein
MVGKLTVKQRKDSWTVDFTPWAPEKRGEERYRFRRSALDVADLLEGLDLRERQRFHENAGDTELVVARIGLSREELLQLGFRPVHSD